MRSVGNNNHDEAFRISAQTVNIYPAGHDAQRLYQFGSEELYQRIYGGGTLNAVLLGHWLLILFDSFQEFRKAIFGRFFVREWPDILTYTG